MSIVILKCPPLRPVPSHYSAGCTGLVTSSAVWLFPTEIHSTSKGCHFLHGCCTEFRHKPVRKKLHKYITNTHLSDRHFRIEETIFRTDFETENRVLLFKQYVPHIQGTIHLHCKEDSRSDWTPTAIQQMACVISVKTN